jgi:CheY-like chemotaxis protein
MDEPQPGFIYQVNFVGASEETRRRLEGYQQRNPDISFLFSDEPLLKEKVDAVIIPAVHLPETPWEGKSWIPLIAYGSLETLERAFEAGCSDYLKSPWTPEELYHRVRLGVKSKALTFSWGKISITTSQAASPFGAVKLSVQESAILKVLAQKQGDVVPRELLYNALWGRLKESSRVVDMHISSLRKKIQKLLPQDYAAPLIRSAHGRGYFIPFLNTKSDGNC